MGIIIDMAEKAGEITLFAKRVVHNPLLARKQMCIEIIHTSKVNISKAQIKENIAKKYKVSVEQVAVYGLKFKFGGGRSTGFALVYDSVDERKKNDQKALLRRDGLFKERDGKKPRKQGKEIKGRVKRVRGTAKAKAAAAGGKKKR